jgi:hypothetical protein
MSKEKYIQILVDRAAAAGIPPHLIHALKKTGLIMSEENRNNFSAAQRRAWDDAVAEPIMSESTIRDLSAEAARERLSDLLMVAIPRGPAYHSGYVGDEM